MFILPNHSIIENGQNTEKSPRDLRRLAASQTPVKYHQLMLVGKTRTRKYVYVFNNNASVVKQIFSL